MLQHNILMQTTDRALSHRLRHVARTSFGILLAALLLQGCATPQPDVISQFSILQALRHGAYDGHMPCGTLLQHGNFGIGTFDGLDGEMIVLDGVIMQSHTNASVSLPHHNTRTPFACVVPFIWDLSLIIDSRQSQSDLEARIRRALPGNNFPAAIRVHGRFLAITLRSVASQTPPYPPLDDVISATTAKTLQDVTGTLVGFYFPDYVGGIQQHGFHFHFVTDNRKAGGHALAYTLQEGTVEIDSCTGIQLLLPAPGSSFASIDMSEEPLQ